MCLTSFGLSDLPFLHPHGVIFYALGFFWLAISRVAEQHITLHTLYDATKPEKDSLHILLFFCT